MAKIELGIQTVNLDLLVESPFWCRKFVEDEEFWELVESIKRIGVIEPPVVRSVNGKLEIVCGHRRVLAARKAELKNVLVDVRKLDDEKVLQIQLIENIHRKDLSDFEKAMFLKRMIDKFGYTQDELAKKIGKSHGYVTNHLRMLKLEQIVSQETMEKVGEAHARTILSAPEQKRAEVIEKVEETIKETGKPPTIKQIQNMTQLPECERCHIRSSTVKPEKINGKPHNLCDKCSQHAKLHSEEVVAHFRFLERAKEGKVPPKLAIPLKPTETWEYRKGRMQPFESKNAEAVIQKLHLAGYKVESGVEECTYPIDWTIADCKIILDSGKAVPIFFDGPQHKGKLADRDDYKRQLLAKILGFAPVIVKHSGAESEQKRMFDEVVESLKW